MRPTPLSVRSSAPPRTGLSRLHTGATPTPTRSRLRDVLATIPIVLLVPAVIWPLLTAQARSPSLEIQGQAVAEEEIVILARGFRSSDRVQLLWNQPEETVAWVTASRAGRFSATIQVPEVAPGTYTVSALVSEPIRIGGYSTVRVAAVEVTIDVPPTSAEVPVPALSNPSPSPSSQLESIDSPALSDPSPFPSSQLEPIDSPEPLTTIALEPAASPAPSVVPPAAPTSSAPPVVALPPAPTPAPVTIQPPPPPPPPPSGTLLFVADAETGDASQWCYVHSGVSGGATTERARAGSYSFRSEIQDGVLIYDSERSEYANGPNACTKHLFYAETETWTALSLYLDPNFPAYSLWSLVAQWKEPFGGSPPSQIGLQNEQFNLRGVSSESPRKLLPLVPIVRGQWIDFLIHHYWSPDPTRGFVEVYVGGDLVLPRTYLKTMENTNPLFLSVGHYRDTNNSGTAVLFVDEVRVGTTRSVVELAR